MREETDIVNSILQGVADLALTHQVESSGKSPAAAFGRTIKAKDKQEKVFSIPVVIPMYNEESTKTGGGHGVNHLNLIQIKGKPAHSWQPRMNQDAVIKPSLCSLEVNKILLKTAEVKKK